MIRSSIKHLLFIGAAALLPQLLYSQSGSERQVTVSCTKVAGALDKSFNQCVGAGRANEGLRADWQRQLTIAKKECGFRYIRFHGLLTDDMGVYSEDRNGNPVYNWQYIDELYDFLLSIKVRPFVELGFMPQALASGKQTIFWWRGNITPPKDYEKWKGLISHLVEHWTERYGRDEVRHWFFEVWNEPNLKGWFFTGEQADYFKLYRASVEAIKGVDASYKVGGPATAGNAWVPDMINFCVQNNLPIDFISTHDYGVREGFLDASGGKGTVISPDKNVIVNDMRRSRKQIEASRMPHLQLNYTEWSSSYTPSDPLHDTYEEASYILNTVKGASPYVNAMSYWTFTDIFEEAGPRMTPFHGGFGLMNYQDIKKPAYYAFKYLNELGDSELANSDSSSIICKDNKGNVQALLWDCTIDHPDSPINNQEFYKRDIPPKPAGKLKFTVHGLQPGAYRIETYRTGYHINDAYSVYYGLHSPSQLTRQQVAAIKQQSSGVPSAVSKITIGKSGEYTTTINLRQNDVYFIKLMRL
ncbi:MAG: GH39 family glycosyl hydrolase [Mucilaginibacter sp.]